MRQQAFNMPVGGQSGTANGSWRMGTRVILELVLATLVLSAAIWYFGLPS